MKRNVVEKKMPQERILARVLADRLHHVCGGDSPIVTDVDANGRRDITMAGADKPSI